MTTDSGITQGTVCSCEPVRNVPKTYYIWSCSSDEKQKVYDVIDVYVTKDAVVFEKATHEIVSVPRYDIFMVTCEICSSPPWS